MLVLHTIVLKHEWSVIPDILLLNSHIKLVVIVVNFDQCYARGTNMDIEYMAKRGALIALVPPKLIQLTTIGSTQNCKRSTLENK